jgi:hypothetical protein
MAPKRVAAAKAGTTKNTQSPIRKSTSTADERAKARHERQAATKAATEARLAEDAKAADRARQIAEKKRADRAKNGAKRQAALKKAAAKSEPTTTTATKKRKATAAEDEPTPKRKNTASKSFFQHFIASLINSIPCTDTCVQPQRRQVA